MVRLNKFSLKEKYDDILKYILFLLIILQGLFIFLINFLQTDAFLFFDNATAIRHGIEMWRKGIFLEGYHYFSTMEIDNAAFFAVPLYFLTNHLGLSLGIVHVLLYALCVYLIYSLFKNGEYDTKYGLVGALFLFSPYVISGLDWGNMMFVTVGQYEFRVMVMISLANLMVQVLNNKTSGKQFVFFLIFNIVLCFWTSLSCGNYVLLMIILPFIIFYIFYVCNADKLVIDKYAVLVLGTAFASCVAGWLLRSNFIGETSRNSLPLLTADTFSINLQYCITGFFMLFGALDQEPNIDIFSPKGILKIFKIVFILTCMVLVIAKFKKLKKKDSFMYMFIFVAIVNLMVMIFTFTRYGAMIFEYRYHIIWGAMFLLAAIASIDVIEAIILKRAVFLGMIFMCFVINYGAFNGVFIKPLATIHDKQVIEVAKEQSIDTIYVYDMPDDAATIRVLDFDLNCMSVVLQDGVVKAKTDNYFIDYSREYDYSDRHLFICRPDSFELLPDYIKSNYKKIKELQIGWVFIGDINPWLEY